MADVMFDRCSGAERGAFRVVRVGEDIALMTGTLIPTSRIIVSHQIDKVQIRIHLPKMQLFVV